MNLRLYSVAQRETAEAALWYDEQEQGLGDDFLKAVDSAISRALEAPDRWPVFLDAPTNMPTRHILVDGFPYVVLYFATSEELVVVSVAHSARLH